LKGVAAAQLVLTLADATAHTYRYDLDNPRPSTVELLESILEKRGKG
jgi:hypothetical protein